MTTLTYSQRTGQLSGPGISASGYSGHQEGKNNPALETDHGVGPIPRGTWRIGAPVDHPHLGPRALPLSPAPGTETFGRSGFFVHGDSSAHPGDASHGCIVLPRNVREAIVDGGFDSIEVTE